MTGRVLRTLTIPAAAIALATVPAAAASTHAQAAPNLRLEFKSSLQGGIWCQMPALSTGFGAIAQCSRESGGKVVFGSFSLVNNTFGANTSALTIVAGAVQENCSSSDASGICLGHPVVSSGFGPVTRATQYQSTRGRVGWYSPITKQFSPDTPNGGWFPLFNP